MKKFISLILLILSVHYLQAATGRYRLMFNDDPSSVITIGWDQFSGTSPAVYYGPTDYGTNWASYPNSLTPYFSTTYLGMNNRFVKITGLTPNTAYYFVIKDSEGTSQRYWFKTCPNVNTEPLSLISGGDSRSGQTQRINSNKMVAKIRPHAVLFGGDLVNTPSNTEFQMWMDDWQFSITSDNQIIPLVHSYGNHEAGGSGGPYLLRDLFDVTDDAYYRVIFGGDLFSVYTLNGELLPGHTIPNATKRTQQTAWLNTTLTADNSIWKAAQYHRPIVPHDSGKGEGQDEFNDWAQLFYDNGVRLVMESDAHVVKVTEEVKPLNPTASGSSSLWFTSTGIAPDKGITFIGEGSWGTTRDPDDIHPMTLAAAEFYQFSWLIIDQCKIEVRTIDTQSPNTIPEHVSGDLFSISPQLDAVIWKPAAIPTGVVTITKCNAPDADFVADNTTIFSGTTVNFTDLSTNTPTSWSWNFGDGGVSTSQNPSYVYNTPGTYTVVLNATNADGTGVETKVNYITVIAPTAPTSNFVADDVTPTVSQSVNFTDLSVGNPTSWAWDFGDGQNSTLENPSHAYTASGTYTVTLTATNIYGNDIEVKTNYITVTNNGSVTVAVINGNDDVEENNGTGVIYYDSSDLEFTRDGTFNQNVGVRFQNVTVPEDATITNAYIVFRADESHSTTCTVHIAGVDQDNATAWSGGYNVSTRPKTTAQTDWNFNGSSAWTGGVTISNTPNLNAMVQEIVDRPGWVSGNSMSFVFWDFPTTTNKRVADPYEGGYAPQLVIEYSIADVVVAPVAAFNSSTTTICQNGSVNFSDVSSNIPTSWSWNFGDGNVSTAQNPSHTYTSAGTYTITLTATNSGGSDVITQTNLITVTALPNVNASANTTICAGQSTSISVTGATSYSWDNGLGAGSSHTVSPATTTTYMVTGTQSGCQNTDAVTITVTPLPNVNASANTTICAGQSTNVSATGATTYTWNNGLGAGSNHTITPTSTITYTVTGTQSGCQNTDLVTITVTPLPIVTASNDVTICAGESTTISGTGASTYTWDNGLGIGATKTVSPASTLTYTVTGTLSGCTNTDQVTVNVTPLPTVNAGSNTSICEGNSTTISASGATSYSWNNGLGAGANHSVSPTVTTTYIVTGTENGCENTSQIIVTVDTQENPGTASPISVCVMENSVDLFSSVLGEDPGGTWSDDDITGALTGSLLDATSLAVGNTYNFTYQFAANGACPAVAVTTQVLVSSSVTAGIANSVNPTCDNDVSYDLFNSISGQTPGGIWSDDDATGALTGSIFNPSGLAAGTYHFTYAINSAACGSDAETTVITINPSPAVDAGIDQEICAGSSATITSSGATTFDWDNSLGAGNSHLVSPLTTTTYAVTGVLNGCTNQDEVTISVNDLPTVILDVFSTDTICRLESPFTLPAGSPAGGTYSGTGVSGNQFTPADANLGLNIVTYTFTDINGCSNSDDQEIEVINCLNVLENNQVVFKIYPNPTSTFIVIERAENSDFNHIVITDMSGKIVYDKTVFENPLEINVDEWNSGTYNVIFINSENQRLVQKIVVE